MKNRKDMKRFNIWLPVSMYEKYKKRSNDTGIPMTYLMYMDLENYEIIKSANENIGQALKLLTDEATEEEPKA
jgi:hypothetical protein